MTPSQVNRLSNPALKCVFFACYSTIGDIQACQVVNMRSKRYLSKLNEGISEEEYTIREQLLEKEQRLENLCSNNEHF